MASKKEEIKGIVKEGYKEIARTGPTAISRGTKII